MDQIQEVLSQVVQQSKIEIYLVDEHLKIFYANQAALDNLGYSLEELTRLTPMDINARLDQSQVLALGPPVETPGVLINVHNEYRRKNGSTYPAQTTLQKIDYQGNPTYVAVSQDITEKQSLLDQLNMVMEGGKIGYWDRDLKEGKINVSDRTLAMLGLEPGDLSNDINDWFELMHPDDLQRALIRSEKAKKEGNAWFAEHRTRHKDGHWVYLLGMARVVESDPVTGEPLRICGTHVDITEQKLIEQELESQQAIYKSLAENTEDYIARFDRNYRHIDVNQAVSRYMDSAPENLVGKTLAEINLPAELKSTMESNIQKVFSSGEPRSQILEMPGASGHEISVFMQVFPEFSSAGEIQSVFQVGRDISLLRRAEEERQKMQKLSSLGVLAGGIAHDFNNILTILFGNISFAQSQLELGKSPGKSLEKAENALQRATNLTSQLLTFAKGGDPVREHVRIDEMIEEIMSFDLSGSNVKVDYRLPEELWVADVDKGQISQVFSNLTSNANQAMKDGGTITLHAENIQIEEQDDETLRNGKYIRFVFTDQGAGIEKGELDKIFDPYYSTKPDGSGLGLAIVHSIIDKHGGKISVESVSGEGTSITFLLPAVDASDPFQASEAEMPEIEIDNNFRVLVMDDEVNICELVENVLEAKNYSVTVVHEGEAAIKAYRTAMEKSEAYDCLLIDLTIPGGLGGVEVIKALTALDPSVKAVVTSGYASDPVLANFADYGFKECLTKPFTMKNLLEKINYVCKH